MSKSGNTQKEPRPLNLRQRRFVVEYLQDMNATQAAVRAGYSKKTAYSMGHDLLKVPEIKAAVAEALEQMMTEKVMSASEVLAELSKIGRGSLRGMAHITPDGDPYLDLNRAGPDDLDALAEVAIEDFVDAREIGEDGKPIKRDVRRVKVKHHNKVAALTTLAKYHGLLVDKVEVSVDDSFAATMAAAEARVKEARRDEEG